MSRYGFQTTLKDRDDSPTGRAPKNAALMKSTCIPINAGYLFSSGCTPSISSDQYESGVGAWYMSTSVSLSTTIGGV